MFVNPYLFFPGTCEAAFALYRDALGGKVDGLYRMKDAPPDVQGQWNIGPAAYEKIMHITLKTPGGVLMGSDNVDGIEGGTGRNGTVSVTLPTAADAERVFAALSEGGKVTMPMMPTFWASRFGTLTDRFGVDWTIGSESPEA